MDATRQTREKYETGLVLSGCVARGFAHIGVLKALHEFNIAADKKKKISIYIEPEDLCNYVFFDAMKGKEMAQVGYEAARKVFSGMRGNNPSE